MEERKITTSGYLITAALQMISILCAVSVFIMEKQDVGTIYYLLIAFTFFSFILSIYFGAKGMASNSLKESGNKKKINPFFNNQAIFSLIGLILFLFSIYVGIKKSRSANNIDFVSENQKTNDIEDYSKDIEKAKLDISYLTNKINLLNQELAELKINNVQEDK